MAYPLASGTFYYVEPGGDLEGILGSAVTGDVVVLSAGIHTLAFSTLSDVPGGVSIRGMGPEATTVHVTDPQHFVGQYACFYDLTFTTPTDAAFLLFQCEQTAWFENVVFNCLPGLEGAPLTGETVTFKRCTFDFVTNYEDQTGGAFFDGSPTALGLYSPDGLHNGRVICESCLFIGSNDWGIEATLTGAFYDLDGTGTDRGIYFNNCTFYGRMQISTDLFNGVLAFRSCVEYNPNSSGGGCLNTGDASNSDLASSYDNYSQLPSGTVLNRPYTTLTKVYLHDQGSYALRNESPARDTGANDFVVSDRNYMYHSSGFVRSAGAFQWAPESSAIYEPWYLDPADGFLLTSEDSNTSNFTDRPAVTQVNSQVDLFNHLRRIVYDILHPSRCEMFWTLDGGITIRSSDYQFGLTITGSAAKVFGAQTFSNVYTTEA